MPHPPRTTPLTTPCAAPTPYHTPHRTAPLYHTQTLNNGLRERGTMTEPPPSVEYSAQCTQWEIFDGYIEGIEPEPHPAPDPNPNPSHNPHRD